ncbi:serine/threonine-protein kinase [Streptomyces sp. NBC_00847]|uniref:serine/threonine-protein kinase n=1 Tax=unclassified Streptomyces TaxID=2593676 RepID=UPI00224DD964|nr:serine/threonine-protein kinase [Streptomyces sp. NBC_00847]MCX4880564.1 serine/threonine protein kinase [Streptomyces sp. NBC_00847]
MATPEAGHEVAGRYRLQDPIGQGGMGVVWRAWDETLQRHVAVKCARPGDETAAKRLQGEGRYAARLHHPNIVPVFDFVEDGSVCWIVMEYVPSRSLAQIMADDGPLTPGEAGSVGCQIAAALAKSHAAGVVHGDVTPENILVTTDGVARLTDFGIARALWSDVTQTTTGVVHGKPRYLAPEVAKGRPVDEKSDVFSLGASLYAAVEGHSPYGEVEHPVAYVARAIEGHIEPAEHAGHLTGVLAALLEVEPRNRPDALESYRLLTHAAPPPAHVQQVLHDSRTLPLTPLEALTIRLPRPLRRRRRPLAITVGALLAAGALTAGLVAASGGDRTGGRRPVDAKPSATAKPGAMGDPRTADPCKLLDAASLIRFGGNRLDPDYGEFDRCDVLVHNSSGDDNADLEVNFNLDAAQFGNDVPTKEVGDLTIATMKRDGPECSRIVATADGRQIEIKGKQLGSPAPDPCALADAGTEHAVALLERGPVPRRSGTFAAASLARVDACALLDAAALKKVPGVGTDDIDHGFGDWYCEWDSADENSGVELQFSQDNSLDGDGEKAVVVSGKKSYVSPKDSGDDTCAIRTPHRSYTNQLGDRTVELFVLTVYGPGSVAGLCADAEVLAATVVKNIAKSLPTT